MSSVEEIVESTEDWLEWRRHGIGASDVAGVVGISPWSSRWSIWADKVGLIPPKEQSEVMEAGHWLEAAIYPWFESRTGLYIGARQLQCTHPENQIARCTIDGRVYESPSEDAEPIGLIEIKTTGPGKEWIEVPAHYVAQAQWQMYVTGTERVWFAVLMGRRLDIHKVERDDDDIEFMVERVEDFWSRHVVTGKPPPTDGHDATLEALKAVYPHTTLEKTVALDDVSGAIELLRTSKADGKAAKKIEDAAKNRILQAMGDAEIGTVDGEPVFTLREQSKETVSPKALRASHPKIARKHVKTSSFRVLRETGKGAA